MADKYSIGFTAVPKNPFWSVGKKLRTVTSRFSITSANSAAGDVLVLSGPLTYSSRIARIFPASATPALTGATDNDLGFYRKNPSDGSMVEVDKDILWDGVTLASAITYQDLLTTRNTSLDTTQNIGQLLGSAVSEEPAGGVFLCLTMNNANTASGPLILELDVEYEEATTQ